METLLRYPWPGNLRELDSALKVATLLTHDIPLLQFEHLVEDFKQRLLAHHTPAEMNTDENNQALNSSESPIQTTVCPALKHTVDQTLLATYHRLQGNVSQTAQALGISRNTVYRKLKKLGIDLSH